MADARGFDIICRTRLIYQIFAVILKFNDNYCLGNFLGRRWPSIKTIYALEGW